MSDRSVRWPTAFLAILMSSGAALGATPVDPPIDPDELVAQAGETLFASGMTPIGCQTLIRIGDGLGAPGSTTNPLTVQVTNTQPLGSIELDVSDIPDELSVAGCDSLVSGFQCAAVEVGGAASIVFDSTSSATLDIGTDVAVFTLLYDVDPAAVGPTVVLLPQNMEATDEAGDPCPTAGFAGEFEVLACGNGVLNTGEECDDGNTDDGDCCNAACLLEAAGSDCDDGFFCTLSTCDGSGSCQSGMPLDCDDGIDCTDDSCDDEADTCVHLPDHAPCANGFVCDGEEFCDPAQGCVAGTPAAEGTACDDGFFCTVGESCDGAGSCAGGAPPNCQDGIPCTEDSCDIDQDSCVNVPDDTQCDDGKECSVDTCLPNVGCDIDLSECLCIEPCDDGIDCTMDSCDPESGCVFESPQCDDGVFCNGVELCSEDGGCLPGEYPCLGRICVEETKECLSYRVTAPLPPQAPSAQSTPTPPGSGTVPTVSSVGLILMGLLLVGGGALFFYRRSSGG